MKFSVGFAMQDPKIYKEFGFARPDHLVFLLNGLALTREGWWSVHTFTAGRRNGAEWRAACGVCLDLDAHRDGQDMPWATDAASAALLARVEMAVDDREHSISCNLWHTTPKGLRLVYVFDRECTNVEQYRRAAGGAQMVAQGWLRYHALDLSSGGLSVDEKCTQDRARLMYLPTCRAKGVQRQAEVRLTRSTPTKIEHLEACYQEPKPAKRTQPSPTTDKLRTAIIEWNAANGSKHGEPFPPRESECPICGGSRGFKCLPSDNTRWVCWSASHAATGVGYESPDHTQWSGTAIDIARHERGAHSVYDVLREDGFWTDEKSNEVAKWSR